jgi:hypothetical protein
VPLANRNHGGSDPAASAIGVRRENWSWLPLGAIGAGAPVGSPDLADRE